MMYIYIIRSHLILKQYIFTNSPMRTKILKLFKHEITNFFDSYPSQILRRRDIEAILSDNRSNWKLPKNTTVDTFIDFLLSEAKLQVAIFKFPHLKVIRYNWGDVSDYELILSLKPDSYFTHYTAMYLHELTDQIPKSIYLNFEQRPKSHRQRNLEQNRIDWAFRQSQRITKNVASFKDQKIYLLNGMYTGKLGVINLNGPEGELIFVTDVERTLIDITVRPSYSGGVFEVLKAFKFAKGKVSINKLTAMLKNLDYLYPYHQAIGFYLDRAGVYKESTINLLKKFEIEFDFYLTHQMKDMDYSKEWRLYYPKGL
jgi:predicted transcriptional regulator of viral defense system